MEKLSKTAKVLKKIIKVLRGVCFGFGIACAVLLVIGIVLPDRMYDRFVNFSDMSIDFGNVMLQLSKAVQPVGSVRLPVCVSLAGGLICLVLSAVGLDLLHRILAPMAEARPFDGSVAANLRKLGWLTFVGVFVISGVSTLTEMLAIRMYDLETLFAPGLVTGVTVQNETDLAFLLIPALLFLLSYVFQYGEALQKQMDETL